MIFKRPVLSILVLLALFLVFDVYIETNYPALIKVNLMSDKIQKGTELKILQITDLHDKSFGEGEESLMRLVNRAQADVAVITGDLADIKTRDFTNILAFTAQLEKKVDLVCFVPGNHEQGNPKAKQLYTGLNAQGVKLLFNEHLVYTTKNVSVNICGINYPFKETASFSGPAADRLALTNSLAGVDTDRYTVVLSHSPKIAYSVENMPVDLILSGHTHGGQIRLPFVGSPLSLDPNIMGKYDKGVFKLERGLRLVVDSGLGTSIIPVRFCDRADMTLITIKGK